MQSDGENESFNVESIKNDTLVKKTSISTQNYKIIYIQAQPFKMFSHSISQIFLHKCFKRDFTVMEGGRKKNKGNKTFSK